MYIDEFGNPGSFVADDKHILDHGPDLYLHAKDFFSENPKKNHCKFCVTDFKDNASVVYVFDNGDACPTVY